MKCPRCEHDFDDATGSPVAQVVVESEDLGAQKRRQVERRRPTKLLMWLASLTLLIVVALVSVSYLLPQRVERQTVVAPLTTSPMTRDGTDAPSATPVPLSDQLDAIELGVVKITSAGPGTSESLGSGFVVTDDGLVATSFHVMAEATEATAVFKDGTSHKIAGYAAVDVEHDLAIVKLETTPLELNVLQLQHANDPRRLAPVIAIGHPHGNEFSPFDGMVSRVLQTSELPQHSQRFLRQYLEGSADHRWIQHTAQISAGNSGGPLLDEQGHVIGVNTWVDRQAELAYALHASHVQELRDRISLDITPLERHAKQSVVITQLLKRLDRATFERQLATCEQFAWYPKTKADYQQMQRVAWAVTVAHLPNSLVDQGGVSDEKLESLVRASDTAVVNLRQRNWQSDDHVAAVNRLAIDYLQQPLAGVFCFGEVTRTVAGSGGSRGVLMKLVGTDETIFLPLDGTLFSAKPGTLCLILGVNYDGRVVRYGANPLDLTTAPAIASRTILPLK